MQIKALTWTRMVPGSEISVHYRYRSDTLD